MTKKLFITLAILLALTACTADQTPPTPTEPLPSSPELPTDSPQPTETEVVVYVAMVNGEGISQAAFDASLSQFQAAQAQTGALLAPGEDAATKVLDDLINRQLLSQAARANGFTADEVMVAERMATLTDQLGGADALGTWMVDNGYTTSSFREALKLEIEAAWQREQIFNTVPRSAEQVEVRQVLFYDPFQAQRAYTQLQDGTDFQIIVNNNDPQNLGYLGWFPRGYLLVPALEDVAFSLQPEQYSEIIETDVGYHILYVLDRDPDRALSGDALITLQAKALNDWLAAQRAQSQIEILAP
jgi:peptidyl-prolyl cis-trans isomerase C